MGRTRDQVVETLLVALTAAGHSMRSASLALDLNHSYLSQFLKKKDYSPDVLPEDVRLALAQLLNIDEKFIKIDTPKAVAVKTFEGKPAQIGSASKEIDGRRNVHMRVDSILEEIGRIKERLDRLEEERSGQQPNTSKSTTRP